MEEVQQVATDGDEKSAIEKTQTEEAKIFPRCNNKTAVRKPEEVIIQLSSMLIRSWLDQVSYLVYTLKKMLIN